MRGNRSSFRTGCGGLNSSELSPDSKAVCAASSCHASFIRHLCITWPLVATSRSATPPLALDHFASQPTALAIPTHRPAPMSDPHHLTPSGSLPEFQAHTSKCVFCQRPICGYQDHIRHHTIHCQPGACPILQQHCNCCGRVALVNLGIGNGPEVGTGGGEGVGEWSSDQFGWDI